MWSITMLLCQTKFDLMNEAAVSNQAEALAIHLKLPFFRVSTKDNFNVSQLLNLLLRQVCKRVRASTEV